MHVNLNNENNIFLIKPILKAVLTIIGALNQLFSNYQYFFKGCKSSSLI